MGWIPFKRNKAELENPAHYHGLIIRKHANEDKSLKGIEILQPVDKYQIPANYVAKAVEEGWMFYPDGSTVVHRPGGNPKNKWSVTHTFVHAPTIGIHTLSGDVRFKVVQQPDKWGFNEDERDEHGDFYATTNSEVRWFYLVERV